jgi:hypothetical protein
VASLAPAYLHDGDAALYGLAVHGAGADFKGAHILREEEERRGAATRVSPEDDLALQRGDGGLTWHLMRTSRQTSSSFPAVAAAAPASASGAACRFCGRRSERSGAELMTAARAVRLRIATVVRHTEALTVARRGLSRSKATWGAGVRCRLRLGLAGRCGWGGLCGCGGLCGGGLHRRPPAPLFFRLPQQQQQQRAGVSVARLNKAGSGKGPRQLTAAVCWDWRMASATMARSRSAASSS